MRNQSLVFRDCYIDICMYVYIYIAHQAGGMSSRHSSRTRQPWFKGARGFSKRARTGLSTYGPDFMPGPRGREGQQKH